MKRGYLVGVFASLALLLSACVVSVDGDGGTGLPSGVTIRNASYVTSYGSFGAGGTVEADVDNSGDTEYVLCNNRDVYLTYEFQFSGTLSSWTSYLRGVETGDIAGEAELRLRSDSVDYDATTNTVRVSYLIRADAAPLSVSPQAIVITPTVDGYTQLFLEFPNLERGYQLISDDIPVLANCA